MIALTGLLAAAAIAALSLSALRRDVARRVAAEDEALAARDAAESANHAKSEFLARMSHELRTPLNSVIGFSNVLLKNRSGNLQAGEIGYLERIHANGKHLLGVINDILDLSRVEAKKVDLEVAPVDLEALIRETLAQMDDRAGGGDVLLRADLPASAAPLLADSARLKQVLINLLGNALKFTPEGSVTVRLAVEPGTRRPVSLDVIDTGIGIDPQRLEAVFAPFEQADSGTGRQYGGSGLGLAISRALCELMGFRLAVASEVGTGTVFRILLADDALLPQVGSSHVDTSDIVGLRERGPRETGVAEETAAPLVLVIDDDEDSRTLLRHYLEDAGYRVTTAPAGEAGLRAARADRPHLITLDLRMEGLTGEGVLQRIRADSSLCGVAVVVVSIMASEQRALLQSADALVNKPVERDPFLATIDSVLTRVEESTVSV